VAGSGHSWFIIRAAFGTRITLVTVELRLLGSVQARVDGRAVALGPRKQRLVLAILALEAGRQVSTERMVDLVWPDGPTRTATHAVRVCVSGLRAALAGAVEIVTQGTGYVLATDPSTVDAHRFRTLLAAARVAASDADRVELLDRALGLWAGPALAGAASPATRERLCAGLDEARVAALEDRVDAQLRLGRHRELLDELTDLTSTYPLRERLAGQQMLALYRSGRRGDALAAYRRVRHDLAEQLGLDAGTALQRLEVAILRDDDPPPADEARGSTPAPSPPPAAKPVPPPAQLPAVVRGFAGRADELGALTDLTASNATTARVAVIVGTAGIGKTTLATYWAHENRDHYPDGQLYVNLRGHGPGRPMRPEQALGGLLRALAVPAEQVPLDLDESAALYRTLLADRRILVLLDNAVGVDQVRPLLPAGTGCRPRHQPGQAGRTGRPRRRPDAAPGHPGRR
jgi:DNA-binding SARP family transcriptional activator